MLQELRVIWATTHTNIYARDNKILHVQKAARIVGRLSLFAGDARRLLEHYRKDSSKILFGRGMKTKFAETLASQDCLRAALHSVKLNEVLNVEYPSVYQWKNIVDNKAQRK